MQLIRLQDSLLRNNFLLFRICFYSIRPAFLWPLKPFLFFKYLIKMCGFICSNTAISPNFYFLHAGGYFCRRAAGLQKHYIIINWRSEAGLHWLVSNSQIFLFKYLVASLCMKIILVTYNLTEKKYGTPLFE